MKEHIGERKLTSGDLLVGLGSAALLAGGLASIHEHKNHNVIISNPIIEKTGDHNSSKSLPSTTHLEKFTAEKGIILNQK